LVYEFFTKEKFWSDFEFRENRLLTAVSAFQSVLAVWEKLGIRAVHVVW